MWWEVILDALKDTAILFPFLFVMYILIEVLEHNTGAGKPNRALTGKCAPILGSALGTVPMCGFSVMAAKLYRNRHITLGTLLAVFIATSDEAIPIMLSNPTKESMLRLAVLLGFKFVAALVAGYALNFIFGKHELGDIGEDVVVQGCHHHELGEHTHDEEHDHEHEHAHDEHTENAETVEATETEVVADGTEAVGHAEKADAPAAPKKKKFDFKCFVLHPLLHTLTVSGYVLAVNVLFAVILFYVGEKRLADFMTAAKFAQPFLAGLIGLIPNCASSVVLAQMFAQGNITLGAAFAGLSVNAGLGLAILIRKNRPVKNTVFIALGLYAYSCVIGLLLSFIPL